MPRTRDEESGRCSRSCVLIIIGVLVVMILLGMLIVNLYGSMITKPAVDDQAISYNNFQDNRSHIIMHHSTQDPRTAGKSPKFDIGLVIIVIGILLTILILSSCIIILKLWKKQNGNSQSSERPKDNTSEDSLSSQRETLVKHKLYLEDETEPNRKENSKVLKEISKTNKDDEYEKNRLSQETEKKSYEKPMVNITTSSKVPRQSTSRGKHTNKYSKYRKIAREIILKEESKACKYSYSSDSPTKRELGTDKKRKGAAIYERHEGIENNEVIDIYHTDMMGKLKRNKHTLLTKQTEDHRSSQNLNSMCEYSLEGMSKITYSDSKKTLTQQSVRLLESNQSKISLNQHAHSFSCSSLGTVHSSHSTDIHNTGLKRSTCDSLPLLSQQASEGTSQRVETDLKKTPQQLSIRSSERNQHSQTTTSSSFLSVASGHSKTSMIKQAPCDSSSEYDTDVSKFNSINSSVTDIDDSFARKQTTKHQQPDTKLSIYCRKFESLEDDAPSLIIKLLKRLMSMGDIIENEVQYIHFMHHTVRMMMDAAKKAEEDVLSITCEDFDKCNELRSKCGYKTYMIDSESGFLSIGVEEWDCLKLYKQQRDYVCQRKISENSEFDGSVYIFIDYSGKPLTDQTEIEDTKVVVEDKQEDPLNVLENEIKASSDDQAEIQDIV